ncbi:MAG: hypothetical protein JW987_00625 [Anaerolineaceae bacterium]|nr:hypothetical protein [Anaerolineaceae bacterium]
MPEITNEYIEELIEATEKDGGESAAILRSLLLELLELRKTTNDLAQLSKRYPRKIVDMTIGLQGFGTLPQWAYSVQAILERKNGGI